jgi:hypothetical protein
MQFHVITNMYVKVINFITFDHYLFYIRFRFVRLFWLLALCYKPIGRGSIPDEATGFFNRSNPHSSTMALESTVHLTEISTRNFPGGEGQSSTLEADKFATIYEPIF